MVQAVFVALEILRSLTWQAPHAKPEQFLFRNETEMVKVWKADGGKKADLPKVDWNKEMVLAVFMGREMTGGFSIKIESVLGRDQDLAVLYSQSYPPKDAAVTEGETYPNHVVVIKKAKYKEVKFVDVNTPAGKILQKAAQAAPPKKAQR